MIAKSKTGDIGSAKRAKSFNSGNSIFLLNLKFLLKNKNPININPNIKVIKPTILDPLNKNFVVTPSGIIKLISVMLNKVKIPLVNRSRKN